NFIPSHGYNGGSTGGNSINDYLHFSWVISDHRVHEAGSDHIPTIGVDLDLDRVTLAYVIQILFKQAWCNIILKPGILGDIPIQFELRFRTISIAKCPERLMRFSFTLKTTD